MSHSSRFRATEDPYDLNRFVRAQERDYDRALSEIKSGQKRTHWMWYVFPQIDGLGLSSTARRYAIKGIEEAQAFLDHRVLGPRLIDGRSASEIFGVPDNLKLKSCATLFACLMPQDSVFDRLLVKYYRGERDNKTLELVGKCPETEKFSDKSPPRRAP